MKTYKFYNQEYRGITTQQLKGIGEDGIEYLIPIAEENRHYQDFLDWVAEGNTAEEAD